jgi:Spy/CpxP family protein refolding chaperone
MKKSSKIILASVVVVAVSGSVFAYGARHHFENMSMQEKAEMFNYHISRKLDLNTEQEIKLESLSSRFAEIMQQVRQQKSERSQFIEDMLADGPLDQAAILQKINEKTELVNQNAPEVVALMAQFIDSLDSAQKQELGEMIQHRGGHGGFAHRFGQRHEYSQWIDG